jgi:hypothetical protein
MECFTHEGKTAVGVCKACGKAVCRSCAKDIGFAVACSDTCATEYGELNEMNQRGKRIYGIGKNAKKKLPSGVTMWLLFAVFFGGFGILPIFKIGRPDWFFLIFSGISFIVAYISYRRSKDLGLQC